MASLESRVKNSLAYLSDFDSKSSEHATTNSAVSPPKTECIQKLLQRIRTFSQLTWFAKPDWLSPVNCARLGWQNVDVDLLECSKCKAIVSAKLPSSQNIQVYDECCKRLESLLKNGHRSCCSRRSQPTSSDLCQLTLQNRSVELQDFISRVKGLIELKSHLPIIEESALTSLKLTMDEVVPLCRLVSTVCPSVGDVDQSALVSACILALCGWNISTSGSCGELVECTFCNRKIGLWNYFSQDMEFDEELTTTMSGYYDDSNLVVNGVGDKCMETDFGHVACELTAVAQETDLQLMTENPELLHGENTNGEGTAVEREQSIASTKEVNSLSSQSPGDDNVDQEIMDNVNPDLPCGLQTTDASPETVANGSLFSGLEKVEIPREEEIPHGEETRSAPSPTSTVFVAADVLRTADTLCNIETPVAAEEAKVAPITSVDGAGSVDQETAVLNEAGFVPDFENNSGMKCQDDVALGCVETSQETCVVDKTEHQVEESGNVNSMCSVEEDSAGVLDLSRNSARTCDTTNSSTVMPTLQDLSDVGDGDGGVRNDITEDNGNVSDEALIHAGMQGELAESIDAAASAALPSANEDIVSLTPDLKVTSSVDTVGIPDERSGRQEMQLDIGDRFQYGDTAAGDAVTGLDDSAVGVLEEGGSSVPDKLLESSDCSMSCNGAGDLHEGSAFETVSNKAIASDLPAEELNNQLTAPQPDQPSTQQLHELTDEISIPLTSQPPVQPGEPIAKLTEEQLADHATVADAGELEAGDERDVEARIQDSMKRAAASEEADFSVKRRCLARPVRAHFDPVTEHRPWCIWVQDLIIKSYPRMGGGNEEEVKDVASPSVPQHPWIRLFRLLLKSDYSPDKRDVRRALSIFKSL